MDTTLFGKEQLLVETALNKSNETFNCFFLVRTVSDDANVCSAHNAERKNAEK